MGYRLVIPRDLFNQSKLLKCLGKLSVHVADRKFHPLKVSDGLDNPIYRFEIEQNEDGELSCENYKFVLEKDGESYELKFHIPYNNKRSYPLYCGDIEVLDDDGNLQPEFLDHLKELGK